MYYIVKVTYVSGMFAVTTRIYVKTAAKTKSGLCRAIGKAIADQLGTDAFELDGVMKLEHGTPRNHELRDLRNGPKFTDGDERAIVKAARDRLFDTRY